MSSTVNPPRTPDERTAEGGTSGTDRRGLARQQKDRFGGMKFGACFFGWLTATGTAVILAGLLTAVGLGIGSSSGVTSTQASQQAQSIGVASAIVLLVVVFVAYLAGGYVAGRMARFAGVRQGVGVWLWAVVVTIVLAVLGLIAGNRFDVLSRLNAQPSFSVNGEVTTGAVITGIAVVVVALVAAILGGLAGMRYHRRIDNAAYDAAQV